MTSLKNCLQEMLPLPNPPNGWTDGPGGTPAPLGPPHCFRLRRYRRRNFRSKSFSAEKFSAENFSADNFFGRKDFRPKKFLADKFFGRIFFDRKCFRPKKFSAENVSTEHFFGRNSRNFFSNFFRPKNSPSVSPKAEATFLGGN